VIFRSLDRFRDHGLLLLRVGIGAMFIAHGLPKLLAGPESWAGLGKSMAYFGLDFAPAFWGFMAAITECGGGLLVALGLAMRPACVFLVINMVVAMATHIQKADGFVKVSHPAEDGIVLLALFVTGPGRFSLDALIERWRSPLRSGGTRAIKEG